jgi:toluene monooxygenase electron transfer component
MEIELRAGETTRRFESAPGERLLHAGLASGVSLPYECASGTCGSCKATLLSGEIEDLWPAAPGRKYLRGANEFLLCQCAARGDCAVQVRPGKRNTAASFLPVAGMGTVRGARMLAPDVLAFAVQIDRPIDFDAGQFVGLQFPGIPGFRSYSMVNHEAACSRLEFVVKRKRDGALTPWLLEHVIDGRPVEWYGPLGMATFRPDMAKDLLCIGGGTGIAGMMAILACAARSGHFQRHRGHVFFGVRTQADVFYLEELDELARAYPTRLEVTIALSEEAPLSGRSASHTELRFQHGLVHQVAADTMRGRYANVAAYVAGPPPAVDAVLRTLLLEGKVPAADIRYDKFS